MIFWWTMFSIPLPFVITVIGTMVLTAFVYLKSLLKPRDYLPKLFYKESALTKHLLKRCRGLTRPFRPPLWAQNAHVQTFMAAFLPGPRVEFDREYLQMKDRGVVALDWVILENHKSNPKKTNPVLIVLPGMTGDAVSMAGLCYDGAKKGYRVVVFNKRGHGGSVLTTPMLQSFGDPTDLRQVVKYIRGRYPKAKLTAAGISAGSGLLVSYLGEFGSSSYLSAAVCISPGYDAWELFTKDVFAFYDFCLLFSLKRLLGTHSSALSKVVDIPAAMQSKTLCEFDKLVYCKLYGYNSLQEYWEKNNPMRDVDDIAVPVLCINSLDDPICVKGNIPFDLFKYYPNFFLVATEKGGHCGFLEGTPPKPWANKLALEYLSAVLEFFTIHGER